MSFCAQRFSQFVVLAHEDFVQYQLTELLLFYCQVMKVNMVLRKVWFDELSLKAHTYMKTLSDVEVVLSI